MRFTALVFGGLCLIGAASADAGVISLNFTTSGNFGNINAAASTMAPDETAGVVAAANWNNSVAVNAGSVGPLVDDSGAGTTASVSYGGGQANWGNDHAPATGDARMMIGMYGNGAKSPEVTFSLVPYSSYDVYVYVVQGSFGGTGVHTITANGGSTEYVRHQGWSGSFVESDWTTSADTAPTGNYVKFSGLTGSTLVIADTFTGDGGITGIQIVEAAAAVPEPASMAVLGLAGLAVLTRRRRA
jgi:hypothetical protein